MVLPTQTGPGASWGTELPQHGRHATGAITLLTKASASPKSSTPTPQLVANPRNPTSYYPVAQQERPHEQPKPSPHHGPQGPTSPARVVKQYCETTAPHEND